jgi:hypothetical protein
VVIELIGGPLDGTVFAAPPVVPIYMIVSNHVEAPIYRAGCQLYGKRKLQSAFYYFLGYEQSLAYEYPEKSQNFKAIEE